MNTPRRFFLLTMPLLLLAWFFVFAAAAEAAAWPVITAGNTSFAYGNWQHSFPWKHMVAGNDPVLIVSLYGDGDYFKADSVSYGGQPLNLAIRHFYYGSYNNAAVFIYYLANPPQGEHDITVNLGWSFVGSAITFTNCDTANPVSSAQAFHESLSPMSHDIATSYPNSMLVDATTHNLPDFFHSRL